MLHGGRLDGSCTAGGTTGERKRAVAEGMILHRDGGEFTAQAEAVLRGGAAIDIEPGR